MFAIEISFKIILYNLDWNSSMNELIFFVYFVWNRYRRYTNAIKYIENSFLFLHLFFSGFYFFYVYLFGMSCHWGFYLAFYWFWHNQSMCYRQMCIQTHMFLHTLHKLDMWSVYVTKFYLNINHMRYKSLHRMTFSIVSLLFLHITSIA